MTKDYFKDLLRLRCFIEENIPENKVKLIKLKITQSPILDIDGNEIESVKIVRNEKNKLKKSIFERITK